jgi:hypothetical protein
MEFRILGPLEVVADGRVLAMPAGHQRTLLALLIVNANRVLAPDRIADAVWGDSLPGSGTKALTFHVSREAATSFGWLPTPSTLPGSSGWPAKATSRSGPIPQERAPR